MQNVYQKIHLYNDLDELRSFMFEHMNTYSYAEELFLIAQNLFSNKQNILDYIKQQATEQNYQNYKQSIENHYGEY